MIFPAPSCGSASVRVRLFVNLSTWAHALARSARMRGLAREDLLTAAELAALDGRVAPEGVII